MPCFRTSNAPWWRRLVRAAGLLPGWWIAASALAQAGSEEFRLRAWSSENGLTAGDIYGLARARDGFLWLATDAGLVRFDGMRFEPPDKAQSPLLAGEGMSCLLLDRAGALWVGTARGQLWRRGPDGQLLELGPGGLSEGDRFVSLAEDGEGGLWAATFRHGVFCRRQGKWQMLVSANALAIPVRDQVLADAQGRVWLLSAGQLMAWEQGQGRFAKLTTPSAQPAVALAAAHDGSLWVATTSDRPYWGGAFSSSKRGNGASRWRLIPGCRTHGGRVSSRCWRTRKGGFGWPLPGRVCFMARPLFSRPPVPAGTAVCGPAPTAMAPSVIGTAIGRNTGRSKA